MLRTIVFCALLGASALSGQEQGPPPGVEAERPSLAKRLEDVRVDLRGDMTVGEALAFLTDVTQIGFALGPLEAGEAEVTLQGRAVNLAQLLDTLCAAAQPALEWAVLDGVVVHLRKKGAPVLARPKLDAGWLKAHGARKLDVNFDPPVELGEGAQFLEDLLQLEVRLPKGLAAKPIQLRARDLPVATHLTLLADQVGAGWKVEGEAVVFVPRDAE